MSFLLLMAKNVFILELNTVTYFTRYFNLKGGK